MLVILLLLLLLLLQGTGWLLLAMADPPIGRTGENCMLASVAATKLLWQWKRIIGLPYQVLRGIIKEVLIKPTLIVVRLCHHWVRTRSVDPSANHAADIVYLFGLNLWWGRMKIPIETTKYLCACMINWVINVSCITLTLCSTSWTKLCRNPKLASLPGRQITVDGRCGEGNECRVNFINQWSIFHSPLSYAIEVYPVNKIHNFGRCKSKLALLI